MHLAITDLYEARWSNDIHEEWIRNLLKNRPDIKRKQLDRTKQLMNRHAENALVTQYEPLISGLTLPDLEDQHVLAAAIKGKANIIVTFNLKDFPAKYLSQFDIEAQHPDTFIARLIELAPDVGCMAVNRLRQALRLPPKTASEYLKILERQSLPKTATGLKKYIALF